MTSAADAGLSASGLARPAGESRARRWWHSFTWFCRKKKAGAVGLFITLFMVFLAIFGPWITPYGKDEVFESPNPNYDINSFEPEALNPTILARLEGPSWEHWLGTDDKGRDMLTRIILGARPAMEVGVAASALATIFGAAIGIFSAYRAGWVDLVTQRIVDGMIAIPSILFLLLLLQTSEPSKSTTIIALSVLGTFGASRVIRASALSVRNEVYIMAARTVGAGQFRIMSLHVLPNVVATLLVIFTIQIGGNILAAASLEFLGFGVPGPSWGAMVSTGRQFLDSEPLMSILAGGAIMLTVLGLNLLGDALRDVFDPRQRGTG
jgi:peptide/nickel transport system permease protein